MKMLLRLILIGMILSFSACRVNEMGCPKRKTVKLNKRPSNYMRAYQRSLAASARERERSTRTDRPKPRAVKSADLIEEWDCPQPGGKTTLPRAVRANIRKNRKRFEEYYKNKPTLDSLQRNISPVD